VLWLVDGDRAHEITRIPRAATDGHPTVRLARRADGRALGLLVDGLPDAERGMTMRWIMPIDLESAGVGDPEALAPADLSDRAVTSCTGDDAGWVVDLPYPGSVVLNASPAWRVALQSPLARMRVSRDGACVERMGGMVEGYAGAVPEIPRGPMAGEPPPSREARAIDVAVFSARTRYSLRCSIR
jgi:hypothetical protein